MKYVVTVDGREHALEVLPGEGAGKHLVVMDGAAHHVELSRTPRGWLHSLLVDGRSYQVAGDGQEMSVDGRRFEIAVERDLGLPRREHQPGQDGPAQLKAPIPGLVVAVQAAAGDRVEAGQALIVVEAMKMQMELKSPRPGRVLELHVRPGQEVNQNQPLAVIGD